MKIENVPGEFAFKSLVRAKPLAIDRDDAWGLTTGYFFSLEEVQKYYSPDLWDIKWPVDFQENGAVYVPHEDELK